MTIQEPYSIRPATDDDMDDILSVMSEAIAALPTPAFYVADDREFLSRHIREQGFTLVAFHWEVMAGFLVIRFPGGEADNLGSVLNLTQGEQGLVAHMESIAVRPSERGHALQLRLLEAAEALLAPRPYLHWMATVHPDNRYSLANFQRLGYREVMRLKKYGGLDRVILHKYNPRLAPK